MKSKMVPLKWLIVSTLVIALHSVGAEKRPMTCNKIEQEQQEASYKKWLTWNDLATRPAAANKKANTLEEAIRNLNERKLKKQRAEDKKALEKLYWEKRAQRIHREEEEYRRQRGGVSDNCREVAAALTMGACAIL